MSRANRLATLPKPTRARSARMHADSAQELADVRQRRREVLGIRAEADAQIPIGAEVLAGHDQHAAFVAQPRRELRRTERMRVADQDDGPGLGRDVAEALLLLDPA